MKHRVKALCLSINLVPSLVIPYFSAFFNDSFYSHEYGNYIIQMSDLWVKGLYMSQLHIGTMFATLVLLAAEILLILKV